ncbi:MAG TPA: NEW3 domain-containing protein [Xanthobacteraceae bacterium]|nr:NEW3 domain-containing protein [Xanthobacteraceae bacterium]
MRLRFIAAAAAVVATFVAPLAPVATTLTSKALFASPAMAEDAPKDVKGFFLMSDYPAVSLRPGETSTISLRLQNYDMTPERLALSVTGVPSGWTATLLGGGQPVAAAMPAADSSVSLSLRLDVPKNAPMGTQTLTVTAQGNTANLELPIAVTLAKDLPAKLTLTPQLPELRGTSKSSFEYQLGIKNDSGKKLTVSLSAQAPQNFDTSFTEQYGTQELNAVPVDAGQTKDVKLKVTPPNTAAAGDYKVNARVAAEDASATTDLEMTITGQPRLDISGREGLVSTRASAGKETSVPVVITNTGTAPADDIQLTGSAPSGWKVTFDPKTVDRIAPNDNKEVQALITPTDKAIAGDYVTTIRASARGESASANFRVTVTTSTMWGVAGVGIVGVALLVMVGAVARFGRR